LEKEKRRIREKLENEFQGKIDEKLKPIEARYRKQMSDLGTQIDKAKGEASKLKADQVDERKKYEASIAQLQREMDEERIRMEKKKQQAIDKMADDKENAFEVMLTQINAQTELMREQMKEQNDQMRELISKIKSPICPLM